LHLFTLIIEVTHTGKNHGKISYFAFISQNVKCFAHFEQKCEHFGQKYNTVPKFTNDFPSVREKAMTNEVQERNTFFMHWTKTYFRVYSEKVSEIVPWQHKSLQNT